MRFNYQSLSIIAFLILMALLVIAGLSSSINWIGALMVLILIVLILFAIFILRSKEENKETLEDDNWYEN